MVTDSAESETTQPPASNNARSWSRTPKGSKGAEPLRGAKALRPRTSDAVRAKPPASGRGGRWQEEG